MKKKNKDIQPLDFNMAEEAYKTAGLENATASIEKELAPIHSSYDWDRFCFICNKALIAKVKAIADKEKLTIRELMEYMMKMGINRYERKNGALIIDMPEAKKSVRDIM